MLAFDLPDRASREEFYLGLFDIGLLAIRSGERSIRFRPTLDFPERAIATVLEMLGEQCRRMSTRGSQETDPVGEELVKEPAK